MITASPALAVAEMSEGFFNFYVTALVVSGLLLIVVAFLPLGTSVGMRLLNIAIGLGFAGYAFYIYFIQTEGTVRVFLYAFALPLILIYQTFKSRREQGAES